MNNRTVTQNSNTSIAGSFTHVFQAAGLGKAPFHFKEFTVGDTQCDYCATHIHNIFWIQSSDNRTFKVGCDCVEKTEDQGLRRVVSRAWREHQTMLRKTREKRILESIENEVLHNEETRNLLRSMPHPLGFQGKTFLDYGIWMCSNAGTSGKMRLAKMVNKALKEK